MNKNNLNEGIKFGAKELKDVLKRDKDFNVGIEFEVDSSNLKNENLTPIIPLENYDDVEIFFKDVMSYKYTFISHHVDNLDTYPMEIQELLKMEVIDYITDQYPLQDFNILSFVMFGQKFIKKLKGYDLNSKQLNFDFKNEDKENKILKKILKSTMSDIQADYVDEDDAQHALSILFSLLQGRQYIMLEQFLLMDKAKRQQYVLLIDSYFEGNLIENIDDIEDIIKILLFINKYKNDIRDVFDTDFDNTDQNFDLKELISNAKKIKIKDVELNLINEYFKENFKFDGNTSLSKIDMIDLLGEFKKLGAYPKYYDLLARLLFKPVDEVIKNNSPLYMTPNESYDSEETKQIKPLMDSLKKYDPKLLSYIVQTEREHNNMIELITSKMKPTESLDVINRFFKYFSDNDITTPAYAGMHISISTNKFDMGDFNMLKFILSMNIPFIHKMFPERNHVYSLSGKIEKLLLSYLSFHSFERVLNINGSLKQLIMSTESHLQNNEIISQEKSQTIKFGDYKYLDGRIELRFFGGEDYHKRFNEIKFQMARALYLMEIAYTPLYQNEYYKEMYKMIDNVSQQLYNVGISELFQALKQIINTKDLNTRVKILSRLIKMAKIDNILKLSKEDEVLLKNNKTAIKFVLKSLSDEMVWRKKIGVANQLNGEN